MYGKQLVNNSYYLQTCSKNKIGINGIYLTIYTTPYRHSYHRSKNR